MRFQVPQFVDIEDKIIGPLTIKQFLYYVVASLVLVPVYMLTDISLFITIGLPVLGVAALFAHARFRGQKFASLLMHIIQYYTGNRVYWWQRSAVAVPMIIQGEEYDEFTQAEDAPASSLNALVQTLITAGNVITEDAEDPMLEGSKEESLSNNPGNDTASSKRQESGNSTAKAL